LNEFFIWVVHALCKVKTVTSGWVSDVTVTVYFYHTTL